MDRQTDLSLSEQLHFQVAKLGGRFDESVLAATRDLYTPHLRAPLSDVHATYDLAYADGPRHKLDLFAGQGSGMPIVLYVHGGGFVAGDKRGSSAFYANVGKYFASHGFLAATMNYRLATTDGWPAGAEDVMSAVAWLGFNSQAYGGNPSKLFVIGQSAGASHVASYLFDPLFEAQASCAVTAGVLMSGFYEPKVPQLGGPKAYFGDDATQYQRRAPITHVSSSTIPILLTVAQFDPPAIAAQTLDLAKALSVASMMCPPLVWFEGHNHVSTVMSMGTAQDETGSAILKFMRQHTEQINKK